MTLDTIMPPQETNGIQGTAFSMREWFDAWLKAFGGKRAGIWKMNMTDFQEEHGIPYRVEDLRIGIVTVKIATGASNDHTPRFDILGVISQSGRVFTSMMAELNVSMLRFDFLSEQTNLLKIFRKDPLGLNYHIEFCEDSPYVNCNLSWDTYWAGLGETRNLWSRKERKLLKEYDVLFECHMNWQDVMPRLDKIYEVEASGWKGREGTAIKQSANTLEFYNTCVRHWAETNMLRLFTLSLNGVIVAFQINVLYNGVLTQLKVGYDEGYAKQSPGQVLQLQLLRWAFEQSDVCVYDMLGGGGKAEETKRKWATDVEPLYSVYIYRNSLTGWLAWARFSLAPRLKLLLAHRRGKSHVPLARCE